MIKPTTKLYTNGNDYNDYKDFFHNAEYSSEGFTEISYRKVIVNEESIPKEISGQNLVFFERIRAGNMLGVFKYLVYKLPKLKKKLKELKSTKSHNNTDNSDLKPEIIKLIKQIKWFEKNINFFKQKLCNIEKSNTFITPKYGFFCNSYDKVRYNPEVDNEKANQKLVGRLYSHKSIQGLSSEIRYYLFKGEYTNFDMVNSHPSILYEFSKQQNIELNGSLKQYVENRSHMFQEIRKELIVFNKNMKEDDLPDKVIKKHIIALSNRYQNYEKTPILIKLFQDFETIREYLYNFLRNGMFFTPEEKTEYTKAIMNSLKKKHQNNPTSFTECEKKAKIILQVFYCQTQESHHITRLSNFLRKKYLMYLDMDNMKKFTDYYPNTDKKVDLSAIHTLFIIPFFDGIYVSSPNMMYNNRLQDFVKEFNNLNKSSSIRFEHKTIEQKIDNIEDTKELGKFLIIKSWLSDPNSRRPWNIYLKRSGIITKFLKEFQRIDSTEKNISIENSEEYDKYWDEAYQDLINDVQSNIYEGLLQMEFKSEHELSFRIKHMKDMNEE